MSASDDSLGQETGSAISLSTLRGSILARVSRSFYLSIRLLPKKLRDPVSLGYLLARASDTIADTTELPVDLRMENLRLLVRGIQGEALGDAIIDLSASLAPAQKNKAERALIESLQSCLDWLDQSDVLDREEVRAVLEQINRGQLLDLERFQNPKQIVALETSTRLDEYTHLVAGSAGEFWTRLCFRHLPKFTRKWREKAEGGIEAGLKYANAIRNRRVRVATALPGLIGARTLALLRNAGTTALHRHIKVPRSEVRAIVASLILGFGARSRIESLYRDLSR